MVEVAQKVRKKRVAIHFFRDQLQRLTKASTIENCWFISDIPVRSALSNLEIKPCVSLIS